MLLRLKVDYQKSNSDYDDPETIYQWSRCGIVMDSNVPDIKYLLEIGENGIEEHELFGRLLLLKQSGRLIGYKPLSNQYHLDQTQLESLNYLKNELRQKTW